jgi:hypothetical protein
VSGAISGDFGAGDPLLAWMPVNPDDRTVLAFLPEEINGHFRLKPRRFVLTQYH